MSLDAMKQALEALDGLSEPYDILRAQDALRAAIKEAEKQEPVAWMYHGIRHDGTPHDRPSLIWKPEYMDVMSAEKGAKATPLYTAPRQWQGLTEDEKNAMVEWVHPEIIEAIELRLRERNETR